MNTYTTIARHTKDVQGKQTSNNSFIAWGRIAIRVSGDKSLFFNFKVFGKTAEILMKYAGQKGMQVGMTGSLEPGEWKDDAGNKQEETVFNVSGVSLIAGQKQQNTQYQQDYSQQQAPAQNPMDNPMSDESIPF